MESLLYLASVSLFSRLRCSSLVSLLGGGGGHESWAGLLTVKTGILDRSVLLKYGLESKRNEDDLHKGLIK